MNSIRPSISSVVFIAILITACDREGESVSRRTPGTPLQVHITQRSAFQTVASDTLSDSARVLGIHPEPDGDALVVLYSEPGRVSTGLAIVDRKMPAPQLLWPDSVTSVFWTGPHTLAFRTTQGGGIRLVVDVHAAQLTLADTTGGVAPPAPLVMTDSSMMLRARQYTDSLRGQVRGAPQTSSALTYAVTRVVPSADGRLAAFHMAARDAAGMLTNPGWYVLDRESGSVTAIDQVTGPANELPQQAGQWSQGTSFFYAKGRALWEAEVARGSATTP